MIKRSESDLVRACLAYLKARGVLAWRNNVAAFKVGKRFIRFSEKGSADIHGVLPNPHAGKFIAVEAKVGKNKPSESQADWLRRIEGQGAVALVVWSVDDLEFFLNQIGVK